MPLLCFPFLDVITGQNKRNLSNEEFISKNKKWVFDAMLYLNIPLVFGLLFMVFTKIQIEVLATYEFIGLSLSAGILLATNANKRSA
jgi:alkane 1-monooxygenase